jgi:hypothetical protein
MIAERDHERDHPGHRERAELQQQHRQDAEDRDHDRGAKPAEAARLRFRLAAESKR